MKRVQLIAETVSVVCPYCGEEFPAPDGSLFWTVSEFKSIIRRPSGNNARIQRPEKCPSCDELVIFDSGSTAQIH